MHTLTIERRIRLMRVKFYAKINRLSLDDVTGHGTAVKSIGP
jgi:hypothetical protein